MTWIAIIIVVLFVLIMYLYKVSVNRLAVKHNKSIHDIQSKIINSKKYHQEFERTLIEQPATLQAELAILHQQLAWLKLLDQTDYK